MDAWEREEAQVEKDHADGWITAEERNQRLQEIQRDYRDAAQEAALEAFERALGRW